MEPEKEYIRQIQNYMPEMSKAFHDNEKNRVVWVENPSTHNNEYFKYYDHARPSSASKVARIKLRSPEYVKEHADYLEEWTLNASEKKTLLNLLQSTYTRDKRITNWQQIIVTYNDDFFNIDPEDTISGNIDFDKYPDALPIDLPMPDYTKL